MKLYRIANYEKLYLPTDARGKELTRARFVKLPLKPRGMGLKALLGEKRGREVFAIWCLLLEAATEQVRGYRGKLLNHKNLPATETEIAAAISHERQLKLVRHALEVLLKLGWLECEEASTFVQPKLREEKRSRKEGEGEGKQNGGPQPPLGDAEALAVQEGHHRERGTDRAAPDAPAAGKVVTDAPAADAPSGGASSWPEPADGEAQGDEALGDADLVEVLLAWADKTQLGGMPHAASKLGGVGASPAYEGNYLAISARDRDQWIKAYRLHGKRWCLEAIASASSIYAGVVIVDAEKRGSRGGAPEVDHEQGRRLAEEYAHVDV